MSISLEQPTASRMSFLLFPCWKLHDFSSVAFLPSCGLILVVVDGWVCSSNFRLQLQQLRVDCSICFSWHCLCTGPSSHHKLNDGCLSAVSLGMTEHLAVNYFVILLAFLRRCALSAMWRRPLCLKSSCDYVQRKFNWVVTSIRWLTGTAHSFWVLWHRTQSCLWPFLSNFLENSQFDSRAH